MTARVLVTGISDIGVVREENQDALEIHEPTDPEELARKGTLVVLADGMGGLEGGAKASRLAVDALRKTYLEDPAGPREALELGVRDANLAIYRHAQDVEGGRQMGSTLTALAIVGGKAFIAQVGDSRAYRYRRGVLRQVTRDHSLVRELIDRGEIDEKSALLSTHRNILTRGLGLREDVAPDVYEIDDLEVGEMFLVSSDGMHGLVQEDEVAACLERFGRNLTPACEELVRVARDRGGPDNITVALAYIEALPSETRDGGQAALRPVGRGRIAGWQLPVIAFASFAAGVLLTLGILDASRPRDLSVEKARSEVRSAIDDDRPTEDPAARAERLRKRIDKIEELLGPAEDGGPAADGR